ncbi:MAG TPA: M23 family metallopeptidase [Gemmatimonadales bacterium]|nr:M23 family metallopeptidase [Gemmatimonadales bacterium]
MMLLLLAFLQTVPQLPDSTGWGVHVLAIARSPDSAIWVGTYGQGVFVLRKGAGSWEQIRSSSDTAAHAISWDFVHAFGFGPRGEIWYGTVGNGWGLSTDGGKTWKNWEFGQLGPEWQYVVPDGIVMRGDTTYIATADGIKLTWDDGQTWRVITDSIGATTARDSLWGRIPNQYIYAFVGIAEPEHMIVVYPGGAARSRSGRIWEKNEGRFGPAWRPAVSFTESFAPPTVLCSDRRVPVHGPTLLPDSLRGTPWGLVRTRGPRSCATVPRGGSTVHGPVATGRAPRHTWFRRPIALTDQPYIDQTYRFGSTMGGNFQPHQGVEFNNADGTPVHAIGAGVVVHSGPAERGALTVAIRHDRRLTADGRRLFVYSVYYHNSKLLVQVGQRVKAGDVIALVGNTGRATNDHLHLEVHASPFDSTRLIVDPDVRYPPYNTNPELWIDPLPGTGLIAGQVWDSAGQPVYQARIYGLVKSEPNETPFSFIETYGPRNHSDPVYHEHFGISDVPRGEYVLGVEIGGKRVFRRVEVEVGKLSWIEFRP